MERIEAFVFSEESQLRRKLEYSLSGKEEIQVWGAAEVNDEVLGTLATVPPDIALVDIDDPHDAGLALADQVKRRLPGTNLLMLTSKYKDSEAVPARRNRVAEYLDREIATDELVGIVKNVARSEYQKIGNPASQPHTSEEVPNQTGKVPWQQENENILAPLTVREKNILDYVAKGLLNKQIGVRLGISKQTVKNHVSSILRKLNANSRTEAVVLAIRQRVIAVN